MTLEERTLSVLREIVSSDRALVIPLGDVEATLRLLLLHASHETLHPEAATTVVLPLQAPTGASPNTLRQCIEHADKVLDLMQPVRPPLVIVSSDVMILSCWDDWREEVYLCDGKHVRKLYDLERAEWFGHFFLPDLWMRQQLWRLWEARMAEGGHVPPAAS